MTVHRRGVAAVSVPLTAAGSPARPAGFDHGRVVFGTSSESFLYTNFEELCCPPRRHLQTAATRVDR